MDISLQKTLALTALACITSTQALAEKTEEALIEDALSAAPPTLKDKVTVVDWDNNVLREGDGRYTCFPTPKELEGTAPMCLDGPWQKWGEAWANKEEFSTKELGIAYMLAGDGGASNIDPYAEGPTGDNEWIVEGPHLMILVPNSDLLDSLPTDPSQGGPYVMWKGTPYVHIMVPVGARDDQP